MKAGLLVASVVMSVLLVEPNRNRCGRCGEQGAAKRSRGHASRQAARQGKLHKRSAEAPAIDARPGRASESTNEPVTCAASDQGKSDRGATRPTLSRGTF